MRDHVIGSVAGVMPLALIATIGLAACGDDPDPALPTQAAVEVVTTGCGPIAGRGDGLVVAPGRVLTAAHVVAGSDHVQVSTLSGTTSAEVTVFDPANDVAVLAINPLFAPAIPIGTADVDDRGVVVVYRDGAPTLVPVRIVEVVTIRTQDIYLDTINDRPGYELEAVIVPGDSGGVVVVDHRAVAMVWARSRRSDTRAWSVDALVVADRLVSSEPVDTGECTS
ncbi:MAG TPA: trypsin-like peptidase domain-containing protein [Ilumatobacteraceae bacterium]|nr:trypsin-like peptidase domain-containing protein [Ilumatobacteraceae bacterium]